MRASSPFPRPRGRFPPLPASPSTPAPLPPRRPPIDASFSRDAERRAAAVSAERERREAAELEVASLRAALESLRVEKQLLRAAVRPAGSPPPFPPAQRPQPRLTSLRKLAAQPLPPPASAPQAVASILPAPPLAPWAPPLTASAAGASPPQRGRRSPPLELPSGGKTPSGGRLPSLPRGEPGDSGSGDGAAHMVAPEGDGSGELGAAAPESGPALDGGASGARAHSLDALIGSARVGAAVSGRQSAVALKTLSLETERLVSQLWGAEDEAGIAAALARPLHFFHPPLAGTAAGPALTQGGSSSGEATVHLAPTAVEIEVAVLARGAVDSLSARALVTSPLGSMGRRAAPLVRPLRPSGASCSNTHGTRTRALQAPSAPPPPSAALAPTGSTAAVERATSPPLQRPSPSPQPPVLPPPPPPPPVAFSPVSSLTEPVDIPLQAALALYPLFSRPMDALDAVLRSFKGGEGGAPLLQHAPPASPSPGPQRAVATNGAGGGSLWAGGGAGGAVDSWRPFAALMGADERKTAGEGAVKLPTSAALFRRG